MFAGRRATNSRVLALASVATGMACGHPTLRMGVVEHGVSDAGVSKPFDSGVIDATPDKKNAPADAPADAKLAAADSKRPAVDAHADTLPLLVDSIADTKRASPDAPLETQDAVAESACQGPAVLCGKPDPCLKVTCTAADACSAVPKCVDGNPCTADGCDATGTCVYTPISGSKECGCPWWGKHLAHAVGGAFPTADGRTVAFTMGGTLVFGPGGKPLPAPPFGTTWPLGTGWLAALHPEYGGYDAAGNQKWKLEPLLIPPGPPGCIAEQVDWISLSIGSSAFILAGSVKYSKLLDPTQPANCPKGMYAGWVELSESGKVMVNTPGQQGSDQPPWVKTGPHGDALMVFVRTKKEMDIEVVFAAAGKVGGFVATSDVKAMVRLRSGGVAARALAYGLPNKKDGMLIADGVHLPYIAATPCLPVTELADGRILCWNGGWATWTPATGVMAAYPLPADLVPIDVMPAWNGGYVIAATYQGTPWVGHVSLLAGQPLGCQ